MPLITRLFFLLIIAIYSGGAAALEFPAGQSDQGFLQNDDSITSPLLLASGTTDRANAESSLLVASNPEPAGLGGAPSEQNEPSFSCSSNRKRDSTKTPGWCQDKFHQLPSTQPGPSPPVQEFQPEDQIQNNNANTRKPWWEKIPGASTLFRQPSSKCYSAWI